MVTRPVLTSLALLSVVALAACGQSSANPASSGASTPAGESSFPVTIKHALGETTISKKPQRVATVAWANHEVPLALGVVPVGMSKATWGDDDQDGVLPWVEEKLTELGAETPVLFDETDGVPFEQVADTRPDVILAAYSGITQEDYQKLSKIAPVVAYPDTPWGTTLDETIRLNSEAIGLKAEGEKLVTDLEATVDEMVARHSSLKGRTALFASIDATDASKVGFYTTHDPRAAFLTEELGMKTPKAVEKATAGTSEFWQQISSEQGDQLADVDLAIAYGDAKTVPTWQKDRLLTKIPFVAKGQVAVLQNNTPLAAAANPSPLSIEWGLEDYLDLMQAAAQK
ncbi:iron-siderophore ABC transporter substrate-binding protein [Luteococcus peritonei]|uniref:Iron-siderophore ABC transporter substrate-binding protein n=1 Tax=Luteococcus peritonei TaxID=88874 RepID=A0ABW4RWX9_9ACTN